MILRLQSNVFNGFLSHVQCLSITLRLQIPCTLTCTLAHFARSGPLEVMCLLRRCGDVLRIIYDADKNISKDSFCSIDKKRKNVLYCFLLIQLNILALDMIVNLHVQRQLLKFLSPEPSRKIRGKQIPDAIASPCIFNHKVCKSSV